MRFSKLYLKIFLSFMSILIVTELLIFGLFMITAGRIFQSRFEHYTRAKVLVAKALIQEKINPGYGGRLVDDESLALLVQFLAETYDAKVWLTANDGSIIAQSFSGSLPDDVIKLGLQEGLPTGEGTGYRHLKIDWNSYVSASFARTYPVASLHIIFDTVEADKLKMAFAIGLTVIGFIVALLVYFVSRKITAPLKQLKKSTLRIAKGDLAHRAGIAARDEIGELSRSFNYMTAKLEKMIRSGRELTAHVSHELRSPLTRIRVAGELIKDGIERGKHTDLERHIDSMEQDVEQLDGLIDRMLAFSKLDVQQEALKVTRFNLIDLLDGLTSRYQPIIDSKELRISTNYMNDANFTGNQESLATAISNIIDNATKFTPQEGKIAINLHGSAEGIAIIVTNDISRFLEIDGDQLCKPFYRAPHTPAAGHGLGLAIAKKIIEMHAGTLNARTLSDRFEINIHLPVKTVEKK